MCVLVLSRIFKTKLTEKIMGLGYALVTATIFQSFIKWFVGGLRPHFLSVCLPAIPPPLPGLGAPGNAI